MAHVKVIAKNYGIDLDNGKFTEAQENAFQDEVLSFKSTLNKLFVSLRSAGRSLRSRHSKDDPQGQGAPHVSPVKDQVQKLMSEIETAAKKAAPRPDSPSAVLDYFLGKQNGVLRSYRADSPEEDCNRRTEDFLKDPKHAHIVEQFALTADALKHNVLDAKTEAETHSVDCSRRKIPGQFADDPAIDNAIWIARNAMAHYYQNYEDYDLLTYPIMFETGVGEADTIDIIRISPEDAKQLIDERATGCHKLAGSAWATSARFWRGSGGRTTFCGDGSTALKESSRRCCRIIHCAGN